MALKRGIRIHQYLDNWLVWARSHQTCLQHTQTLVANCQDLGWLVNMEKSELDPKKVFDFVGFEPPQSRNRASLRQWQHELKILREDQPDQSMRQSGPFLQSGASVIRWTSGLTSFCTCSGTGSYRGVPLMGTDQPLLTNSGIRPSMSAKMRISLVSWTVSIETDPRVRVAFPPGTSPWCCTS